MLNRLCCVVAIGLVSAHESPLSELNDAIGELGISLLKQVADNGTNTALSAYSISSVLGMALLGAKDETYSGIKSALFLKDQRFISGYKASSEQLLSLASAPDDWSSVVNKANRLYINKEFPVGYNYKKVVQKTFKADVKSVDFNQQSSVQNDINSFVSKQTHGLIDQLLESPLDRTTQLALINALYFRGTWQHKFEKTDSEERFNSHFEFHPTNPRVRILVAVNPKLAGQSATWLNVVSSFNYALSSQVKATIIELPYEDNLNSNSTASMWIILPADRYKQNFSGWLNSLKWNDLKSAMHSASFKTVNVTLPKFEVDSRFDLGDALKNTSMAVAFSNKANFGGMIDKSSADLKIDKVIHAAKILLDEEGTVAAASTVASFGPKSFLIPDKSPVQLKIDRSFVAMIVLNQEGSRVPLFTSTVVSTA